jgi:hypothetical protein
MQLVLDEKIVYDKKGRKKDIILPYAQYRRLMELLEDLQDLADMKEVESEELISWNKVKDGLKAEGRI